MPKAQIQKNNSSGTPGVTWHKKNKKWTVRIYSGTRRIYIGSFDDKIDAIEERKKAEVVYQ